MKNKFCLKLLLIIFLHVYRVWVTAAQEVSYRHIGVTEGLPSSEVYSIIQDQKGYIWLSTDAGVCRFNGHKFKRFTTADGLEDNTVFNLFEDRRGKIWMICYNGAVCYYENGKISSISASDSLMKKLKNGVSYIYSSAMDSGDTLWLGALYGLLKIPPTDNYKHIKNFTADDSVAFILKVFDNRKTVICVNRIARHEFKGDTASCLIQCIGEYNFVNRDYIEKKHYGVPNRKCIYLKEGVLVYSHAYNLYTYSPKKIVQKKTYDNTIIFLYQDRNNDLWVGFSKGGVYKYSKGDVNTTPAKYFTNKSVSGVLLDHEGGIWFSTLESGIYYIPMDNYHRHQNNFLDEKICGLDAFGNKVFIANNKNHILMLNSDNSVDWLSPENEVKASRPTKFYNYNGNFFIIGNKIGKIDTTGKIISYATNKTGTVSGIAIAPLNHDTAYLLLDGNSINKLLENGVWLMDNFSSANGEPTPARSTCMLKTKDGLVYLGTRNGLYTYSDKKFTPEFSRDSIFRSSITCMEQDRKGRLLIGTKGKGIIITKDKKHTVTDASQGLSSDGCTAILPDTNETIWVGTTNGISLLQINNNDSVSVITTINTSHGLPSNEITRLARRGKILYVGTKEGLCEIDVSMPFYNSTPSPILISSVYVNKTRTAEANSVFQYDQNNFRFYIDCLSYKDMFNPSYYYRLKGQDSTLQLSTSEFIDFSNLRPGNYRLEVWGLNNNKVLSATPAIFNFSIAKPFWLKWWFILAEVVAGAAIVFLFIRIRLKDIRKKEEEKTRLNRMIAESQMTALRSQMNPHFIFNAINSIQNYILKQNTQQAYDYLTKFSKLIRMVLSNSKENMITIEQELATLSLYVEIEQLRFDKSFDFEINFDKKVDLENCLIPGMLLQPFVENAIWHGIMPLEGIKQGKITLNVRSDAESLSISIEDNGIGREKSKLINKSATHRSIGMMLSQNRMTILNQARKDKIYNILIEDLYNDKKQPAGTKIIITIPILIQDEN